MKKCQKLNLQEPQRNRNGTANYVNLIMTSTVYTWIRRTMEVPYLNGQWELSLTMSVQNGFWNIYLFNETEIKIPSEGSRSTIIDTITIKPCLPNNNTIRPTATYTHSEKLKQ